MSEFNWYSHLCDYYNVTPEKALELGTRSSGRKPDLPGSKTCTAVANKTFEDIWAERERGSTEDIFLFYKDQGSCSTFRQCVRHKDLENLHISYYNLLGKLGSLKNEAHLCEYGAGVAPFTTTLLKYLNNKDLKLTISICDVDCEHFDFAKYRLKDIVEKRELKNITLNFLEIKPNQLPSFETPVDAIFCFEVLEHVPSPVNVIKNFKKSTEPGAIYIENFIKHEEDHHDDDGPDLKSAKNERSQYYKYLFENFNVLLPKNADTENDPNVTRVWQRK